jgi:RNA polymerase sigma factor (sigma-70 family)
MANVFAGFLTRVRGGLAGDVRPDADLVREYVESRSETAFAELVRRFAPMVWGVCRRTVGHHQHAEDAFQAVFLVLVRKSTAIRPPSAVGGWLHAVAVYTSLRARAMAERRRQRESSGLPLPDRAASAEVEPADPDLLRVLDEEIARLPDKLRAAVALCELDGLGRREAASRLGIAEGTLSSRLAAARKQLAVRLRSRGLALGVGGIAAAIQGGPVTAAPPVSPSVSEPVSALADGAIRGMLLSSLQLLTPGALAVVVLAVGLAVYPSEAGEPQPVVRIARHSEHVPNATGPGTILIWVDKTPLLLSPDGKELDSPGPIENVHFRVEQGTAQLSPGGTRVAFEMQGKAVHVKRQKVVGPAAAMEFKAQSIPRTNLGILDLVGKKETKTLESVQLGSFRWLGDGTKLYLSGIEIREVPFVGLLLEKSENWVYDPATSNRTPLNVPSGFFIRAIGPDGKSALVDERKMTPTHWHERAHIWTIGTDKPAPLLELNHSLWEPIPRFSPDGKQLLCRVEHYGTYKTHPQGIGFMREDFKFNHVVVIDLATNQQMVVKELGEKPEWKVVGLAWSPDGRMIAYVETKRPPRPPGRNYRVVVADPDGKNSKVIHTVEGDKFVGFDWK